MMHATKYGPNKNIIPIVGANPALDRIVAREMALFVERTSPNRDAEILQGLERRLADG